MTEKFDFCPKIRKIKKILIILEISGQWPFKEIHIIYIYYEYYLKIAVLEEDTVQNVSLSGPN